MQGPSKTKVQSYRDLIVWQKAMDLVVECYKLTKRLPDWERFGLASQLQRAAVSVPANIAEGQGRWSLGEKLQHFSIANGSLKEVETHLLIGVRLGYFQEAETSNAMGLAVEVAKMLPALMYKLRARKE